MATANRCDIAWNSGEEGCPAKDNTLAKWAHQCIAEPNHIGADICQCGAETPPNRATGPIRYAPGSSKGCGIAFRNTQSHDGIIHDGNGNQHKCAAHELSYQPGKYYHTCDCGSQWAAYDPSQTITILPSCYDACCVLPAHGETGHQDAEGEVWDAPTKANRVPEYRQQEWLDVMNRLQAIRDEIMGELATIKEQINGLIAYSHSDTQESDSASGSVATDEHGDAEPRETQLEFALRTEAEIRERAYRARSTPTEPPRGYGHDIG